MSRQSRTVLTKDKILRCQNVSELKSPLTGLSHFNLFKLCLQFVSVNLNAKPRLLVLNVALWTSWFRKQINDVVRLF